MESKELLKNLELKNMQALAYRPGTNRQVAGQGKFRGSRPI
jgi:hypothetical protein